jgi:hypothetical protein
MDIRAKGALESTARCFVGKGGPEHTKSCRHPGQAVGIAVYPTRPGVGRDEQKAHKTAIAPSTENIVTGGSGRCAWEGDM